jgi:hypothetical protein
VYSLWVPVDSSVRYLIAEIKTYVSDYTSLRSWFNMALQGCITFSFRCDLLTLVYIYGKLLSCLIVVYGPVKLLFFRLELPLSFCVFVCVCVCVCVWMNLCHCLRHVSLLHSHQTVITKKLPLKEEIAFWCSKDESLFWFHEIFKFPDHMNTFTFRIS